MNFIKLLRSKSCGKTSLLSQAVIEYIVIFVVISLAIVGFISRVQGIFNVHFQRVITFLLE